MTCRSSVLIGCIGLAACVAFVSAQQSAQPTFRTSVLLTQLDVIATTPPVASSKA